MEVAVLIATYNGEKYLAELFDSLIKQTFQDFICYIHDDGSTDETTEVIEKYHRDSVLKMHVLDYPATGSAKTNFLTMLKYVQEPYVMFCDQDDIWLEDKVEQSLKYMKRLEKKRQNVPILIFSDLKVVDEQLNEISESFMKYTDLKPDRIHPNQLLLENVVPGCTSIINKPLYMLARQSEDYDQIKIHDHFLALAAACSGTIKYLNKPLILYRQHSNNEKGAVKNYSLLQRITGTFKRVLFQNYRKRYDEWIDSLQKQAAVVSNLDGVRARERQLCQDFSMLRSKKKLQRVRFYIANKVLKDKHNIWFLIWC